MASTLASPSSTMNDSNAVDSDITSAKKQELALGAEGDREMGSPSTQINGAKTAPIETTGAESQELSASATVTADIASPSSNSISTILPSETIQDESQLLLVSAALESGSPSLAISTLNKVSSESISLEMQKPFEQDEAGQNINPPYSELDGLNTIASAMANPHIQKLSGSIEVITATDLPSSVTNIPDTVSQLIETSLVQAPELPFGPFSAEDTQDIESPSPAVEVLTTSNNFEPVELNGLEVHDQSVSGELTIHTSKNHGLGELSSTEPPKLDSSADLEATDVSPDISLSSYPISSTCTGDDALESGLTNLVKPNRSLEGSLKLETAQLKVCNAELLPEVIQGGLIEMPKLASTAANTPDNVSPSLAPSELSLVPENLEICCSEFQEHRKLAKARPDTENSGISAGGFNVGPGFVDKKVAGTTEPTPSSEDGLEMSPSSSSHTPPIVMLTTPEMSSAKIHEGPSSEISSSLSSPPSWIGDDNGSSKMAETSTFETTNLPLAAGNHHGSSNDEAPLVGYGSATVRGPFKTMIECPEEDVEMDMKSSMSDMDSHLNSGWNFVDLGQNHQDDMKISDQFEFGDSLEPLFDMYVASRVDKEAAINVPDLDLSAAATQETGRSIAEKATKPEHFEDSSTVAEDWSVAATLNSPSLSIDSLKEEFDADNENMDGMYALLASVETGVETQPSLQYEMPNTWKYEPALKSSPEIKMEPISLEGIPHIDPLPLATADHKTIPRVIEEYSSKRREGAPSPEATSDLASLVEDKPSTLKAKSREMSSTDMQLLPTFISKDTNSSLKSSEDTTKCSSKRFRVDAESIGEDQKRPAKKPRQQFVFVDTPQPKFKKDLANQTIELHVGPTNKCILVEKHILTKSPFFALLFNQQNSQQKVSRVYHFPRFNTYSMATIVHWLHYGNIQSIAEDYKADEIFHTEHMIKVNLLCSKLQLRSLMNLTIELLGHGYLKNRSAPTIEEIDMTYSETDQMSGLRIYMAAWARCREHAPLQKFMMAVPWDQIRFKALCKKHPDLLKDMKNLDESSDPESPISLNPRFHEVCWYHDHPEGEQCGVSGETFETACYRIEPRLHEPV